MGRDSNEKKRKQTKNRRIGFGKGKIKGERIMRALKEGYKERKKKRETKMKVTWPLLSGRRR